MSLKKKVLFIGSFKGQTKSGGFGGQMFACNSLISSSLSNEVEWTKIDTTAITNLHVPIYKKLYYSLIRFNKLILSLLIKKHTHILIFSSNGLSFIEKGCMAILCSKFTKAKVIFAPRSGRLKREIYSNRNWFIKKVFKNSDIIICQGASWKKIFMDKVDPLERKYVIQKNWISEFDNRNIPAIDNGNNCINILFLGWLVKDKGIMDLVYAAEYLRSNNHCDFQFLIAGKGKDEDYFKSEIAKRGLIDHFVFKGWVNKTQKEKLFMESDIFVLPSFFEGMPNALLESMNVGLPCLASNVGSIPDVLNNKNGLVFDRSNGQEFILLLERLILDKQLRKKIGMNAKRTIEDEHTIQKAVQNFKVNILN